MSLPLPSKELAGQILARPWVLPSSPGRPRLPGLSSVPSQGSEEEESCTSEVTTSLSEEVLDLRGVEHCQQGASQGEGRRGGGVCAWQTQALPLAQAPCRGSPLWRLA